MSRNINLRKPDAEIKCNREAIINMFRILFGDVDIPDLNNIRLSAQEKSSLIDNSVITTLPKASTNSAKAYRMSYIEKLSQIPYTTTRQKTIIWADEKGKSLQVICGDNIVEDESLL